MLLTAAIVSIGLATRSQAEPPPSSSKPASKADESDGKSQSLRSLQNLQIAPDDLGLQHLRKLQRFAIPDTVLIDDVSPDARPSDEIELGRYWIGLACLPAGPELRKQWNLPENQGLVVQGVASDLPAEKGGIRKGDVLLKAGENELSTLPDLISAIQAAGEKELTIALLRDGKEQTVTVTPAERPATPWEAGRMFSESSPGLRGLRGLWRPGAGVLLHPNEPGDLANFPEDLKVTIIKEGRQPLRILAERGEKSWEVSEETINELTPDVRRYVSRLLGLPLHPIWRFPRGALRFFDPETGKMLQQPPPLRHLPLKPLPPVVGKPDGRSPVESSEERVDKRLDEMTRAIEKLQQIIEELQRDRSDQDPGAEGKSEE
jgi:membrane-associated protease RseP (regulator of RpoE activity)